MRAFAVLACVFAAGSARADPPDGTHLWRPSAYGGWEYDDTGGPVVPNGRVEERQHETLVQAGAATLAASWGASLLAGSIGDLVCNGGCADHAYDLLYLPVAGPAIAAAMPGVQKRSDGPGLAALLVADSVVQAGALVVLVVGMLWHEKVVVVSAGPGGAALGLRF